MSCTVTIKNTLPLGFKSWMFLYKTLCSNVTLKHADDCLMRYTTSNKDAKHIVYEMTMDFVRAKCFKELEDDLFTRDELYLLEHFTHRCNPVAGGGVATMLKKIRNISQKY